MKAFLFFGLLFSLTAQAAPTFHAYSYFTLGTDGKEADYEARALKELYAQARTYCLIETRSRHYYAVRSSLSVVDFQDDFSAASIRSYKAGFQCQLGW